MRTLSLGIIGCGRVTVSHHLPALAGIDAFEVRAIADADADRLRRTGDRFGVAGRFTDPLAMLDEVSLDAVAVCVPPEHHVPLALAALDAGAGLFVEKPVATTMEDCDRLLARAARAGARVLVGLNFRQHRLVREAKRVLDQGALGPLELIRSSHTSAIRQRRPLPDWWAFRDRGGGVLFEVATHHYDLWRYLVGSDVAEVWATSRADTGDDDTGTVAGRTRSGVRISGSFSCRTFEDSQLEIYGRDGRLRLSLYRFDGLDVEPVGELPGSIGSRRRALVGTLAALPGGLLRMRRGGDYLLTWEAQWRHFAEVLHGRADPMASLEDGRAALQVALAATESARTGRAVAIDPAADAADLGEGLVD